MVDTGSVLLKDFCTVGKLFLVVHSLVACQKEGGFYNLLHP